jgi:L-ascorbate metabolism protein UlaG (beta-lactamase superfamily)
VKLTYFGHSCFLIESKGKRVIIDPFLTGNPQAPVAPSSLRVDAVLVTHGHGDHMGDAIRICKDTGALLVGVFELVQYAASKGVQGHPMHIGGSRQFDFGWVKLTIAHHGSMTSDGIYTGNPCGFLYRNEEKTIYHAGDTGLFYDMKLIGEMHPLDVALLPIGDNFTMGIQDAAKAAELLNPKIVIPMHYGTFDVIRSDPKEYLRALEKIGLRGEIVAPGKDYVVA